LESQPLSIELFERLRINVESNMDQEEFRNHMVLFLERCGIHEVLDYRGNEYSDFTDGVPDPITALVEYIRPYLISYCVYIPYQIHIYSNHESAIEFSSPWHAGSVSLSCENLKTEATVEVILRIYDDSGEAVHDESEVFNMSDPDSMEKVLKQFVEYIDQRLTVPTNYPN
jgi:hypothetical protein